MVIKESLRRKEFLIIRHICIHCPKTQLLRIVSQNYYLILVSRLVWIITWCDADKKNTTILYSSKTQFEGISAWARRFDYMSFKLWDSGSCCNHASLEQECQLQDWTSLIRLFQFLGKKQHGLLPSIKNSNCKTKKQKY